MNFGKYHESKNLFDKSTWNGVSAQRGTIEAVTNGFKLTATGDDCYSQTYASFAPSCSYAVTSGETYTLSWNIDNPNIYGNVFVFSGVSAASSTLTSVTASSKKVTFTIPSGHKYVAFRIGVAYSGDSLIYTDIMLNSGSTALPYEPYSSEVWHDIPYYVQKNGVWVEQNTVYERDNGKWIPASSWSEFRDLVRSGAAQSLYSVGTKLYERWGDDKSNAWIVVDYPTDSRYIDADLAQQGYTNRVMLMEEKIDYLRQFDAIEAWLYVETAIPAGTYRFTIPNYDATYGGNKTYIFTSTADVPVGGQLTLTWAYQQNPSAVQAYSSSTDTSSIFNVSITEWDGTTPCTDLGIIKLAMSDADSTYGKLNHIHRARYGSNNYAQSGIRQWFNSDVAANAWWQPTTIFDRPYGNRNTAGRLNTMDNDMKSVIATPTINCITNNLFESPSLDGTTFTLQTAYTVQDKLFPVTHTEVNLSSTPNVDNILGYYNGAGNTDRIKYRADNGNAYHWWLRTPYPPDASVERYVNTSGALYASGASNTNGGVAACIIQ